MSCELHLLIEQTLYLSSNLESPNRLRSFVTVFLLSERLISILEGTTCLHNFSHVLIPTWTRWCLQFEDFCKIMIEAFVGTIIFNKPTLLNFIVSLLKRPLATEKRDWIFTYHMRDMFCNSASGDFFRSNGLRRITSFSNWELSWRFSTKYDAIAINAACMFFKFSFRQLGLHFLRISRTPSPTSILSNVRRFSCFVRSTFGTEFATCTNHSFLLEESFHSAPH